MLILVKECKQCTNEPLSALLVPLSSKMNVSSYMCVRTVSKPRIVV